MGQKDQSYPYHPIIMQIKARDRQYGQKTLMVKDIIGDRTSFSGNDEQQERYVGDKEQRQEGAPLGRILVEIQHGEEGEESKRFEFQYVFHGQYV